MAVIRGFPSAAQGLFLKALESIPESERWNPRPGSEGRQAPELSDADEDDEGRSHERLVEEGVQEAEHDQLLQAARAAGKKD
jgi:hypothetical protein